MKQLLALFNIALLLAASCKEPDDLPPSLAQDDVSFGAADLSVTHHYFQFKTLRAKILPDSSYVMTIVGTLNGEHTIALNAGGFTAIDDSACAHYSDPPCRINVSFSDRDAIYAAYAPFSSTSYPNYIIIDTITQDSVYLSISAALVLGEGFHAKPDTLFVGGTAVFARH